MCARTRTRRDLVSAARDVGVDQRHVVCLRFRSKKTVTDAGATELTVTEKNKAIEDGQNNNVESTAYVSG